MLILRHRQRPGPVHVLAMMAPFGRLLAIRHVPRRPSSMLTPVTRMTPGVIRITALQIGADYARVAITQLRSRLNTHGTNSGTLDVVGVMQVYVQCRCLVVMLISELEKDFFKLRASYETLCVATAGRLPSGSTAGVITVVILVPCESHASKKLIIS